MAKNGRFKDGKSVFITGLFFFISYTVLAQQKQFNHTLSGKIKDKATGEALPNATVQVKGAKTGVAANVDGYFLLTNIPSDTSTIVVTYLGYPPTEVKLTKAQSYSDFKIELASDAKELNTVTVVAAKKQDVVMADRNTVGVIKMTPKLLQQLPNVGEKDVMRSFQLMPGVSASNESSSGMYVRGGTPDQNLVVYDGFTVYHVDHLYGFYSAFNSNALKDVQLYKSSFESRFGGRLASVTEITGKDGNQNKFNIGADVSLLSLNAYAEVPIGDKFSSIVAFRRSYKGPFYNEIFTMFNPSSSGGGGKAGESSSSTVASYFYDLNGKFTYRPTKRDIISLSIYNGTDHLDNSGSGKADATGGGTITASSTDLTNYGNFGSSLKWSRKWSDKLYGNTLVSFSNYYSIRNNTQSKTLTSPSGTVQTSTQGLYENNDLNDFSFKSDYQYELKNNRQLLFGVFGSYYDIAYQYTQNDTVSVVNKKSNETSAGAYLQAKLKFAKDKLMFVPGIRASYYSGTGKPYFEPRALATYALTDRVTLKGATGLYYQFANRITREDILAGSRDFWLLANGTSIPVSSATHFTFGTSYENNNYLFSVEGYYKKLNNLTEYSLRFNPQPQGPGVSLSENFFSGYGDAKGIEFLAQKKIGKIAGWVSYTLGQARNNYAVYSDTYYPANQDVTHEFKAVGIYKLKKLDFSATWVYATGRPYTGPSGAYNVTLLDGSSQNFYTVTAKNGQRLPAYHRMDIAANYKLFGKKNGKEFGSIGLSIFNVYNRINTWYKQYTIVNNQILQNNVNYLGLIPNLTFSYNLR